MQVRIAFRIGATRLAPVVGVVILVTASPGLAGSQRAQRRGAPVESRSETRSIDGSGNNLTDPAIGAAGTQLVRIAPVAYADGFSTMAGPERLSARAISNLVNAQATSIPNPLGASDYLWQWGQFLDHDLDRTDGSDPPEPANIAVPLGDPFFDPPPGTGAAEIPCDRSLYDPATGSPALGPRQQMNQITAWIDASNVYGSDPTRAAALRASDGSGRLKTSAGNLLPFNEAGLPNAGGTSSALFLAGDVRANEQVGLTAMHTLFMREHNRWVALLAAEHPDWDGDRLYEKARQLVGAEMQVITYREFLPALLGRDPLPPYRGYDPNVRADIANEFATAAYRFGHSALSPTLLRLDAHGNESPYGSLALRDAFFAPFRISDEGGIEPLLRGLAAQPCQRIDVYVVDDVRNFLFGAPGSGGFDLASLNIQRGRDHGLPGYNALRAALGLRPARSFAEISSDREIQARLAAAYASPDEVDAWVGGLAEDSLPGGHVGELVRTILVDQFEALRDGDRLWYERVLSRGEIQRVESLRLADVIRLNTGIRDEIQDDVFQVPRERPHKRRHR
jgi:peroxidase